MTTRGLQIEWQEDAATLYQLYQDEDIMPHKRRLQALYLLRQGKTAKEAAEMVGVHPRTIRRWIAWYRRGGLDEVQSHRRGYYTNSTKEAPAPSAKPPPQTQPDEIEPVVNLPKVEPKPVSPTYLFQQDESAPEAVQRIVLEQIDRALWQLIDPPDSRDKGIHDARKCFKKIRAVLRLVRDEIGETVFKQENSCYRDAGRRLASLRESYVIIQTFDKIYDRFAGQLAPSTFDGVREQFVTRHKAVRQALLEEGTAVEEVCDTLQRARARVAHWPIRHSDFSALSGGLRRVYRRGRNRLRDAYATPTAEGFHEWRKRVKYLWYHMRLLKLVWPNQLVPLAEELSQLADLLGDDHDLVDLREIVTGQPEIFRNQGELPVLLALIEYWRSELETEARPLGERIYIEPPRTFVDRISNYWQIWHNT